MNNLGPPGNNKYINSTDNPQIEPSNQDEHSISGTTPESDDDTLQNAQDMGQQLEEDVEHPQEIDIARDIDKAEEELRTN